MSSETDQPAVTLTTDGASLGNPGPGGWAALLEYGASERLLSGPGPDAATNNQMELQAVIEGLLALKKPCAVTLRADSQYVLNGIERLLRGRPLAPGLKNADQWRELERLIAPHRLTLEWVRGHAGDPRNELVDQAAAAEAQAALAASPAYQAAQRQIAAIIGSLQAPGRWTLIVAAPPACWPGRWRLYAPGAILEGRVSGRNPAVAAWRAFVAGLAAAAQRADTPPRLAVLTNAEVVVKQTSGMWKVEHPSLAPLFQQWAALRESFEAVDILRAADSQVLALAADPEPAPPPEPARAAPAKPRQAAPAADQPGTDWTLTVRSGRPARWRLTTAGGAQEGEAAVGAATEPVAVWQACLAGVAAAAGQPGAREATLRVITNYDLLVKQATGVWRVKHAEIQPLLAELAALRAQIGTLEFAWLAKEAFARLIGPEP